MTNLVKKSSFVFVLSLVCLSLSAQIQLPRPSPSASVAQTVGLTEMTIKYSSPGVKGRTIWGGLVPYDVVWRAGANQATNITFSKDVTINGTTLKSGSYSVFIKPVKDSKWTVMLNSDPKAFFMNIDTSKNVLAIEVAPTEAKFTERLRYYFSDFTNSKTNVNMAWENINLSFEVGVNTKAQAQENIDKATSQVTSTYANSANYYLTNELYDEAIAYADKSINNQENWYNVWIKAQALKGKGDVKQALVFAKKAKALGDKADNFFFKSNVEEAINTWK